MTRTFIYWIKFLINRFGIDVVRYHSSKHDYFPPDFDTQTIEIIKKVKPFTQTSVERLFALCQATQYISKHQILGDVVECGVWKGGSMMAVALTLLALADSDRHLYLFDTFEGMTEPSSLDISIENISASHLLKNNSKEDQNSVWCYAPLDQVKATISSIEYPLDKLHFVKGRVEDTLPVQAPERIALLRLDTDWYESTRHELIHLFPRLSPGGVIIIDDYGHWQGVRKAVDEYFHENRIQILLNRIDYTGRIGVKI